MVAHNNYLDKHRQSFDLFWSAIDSQLIMRLIWLVGASQLLNDNCVMKIGVR